MNYEEALKYMESAQTFGCVLELENTTELLRLMGSPQEGLKCIHIAGTNGKGSVAAYIAHVLAAAGYKVGRYLSPAVFDFRERITFTEKKYGKITSSFIKKENVAGHVTKIEYGVKDMTGRGFYHPTCFELETVLAFMEFKEAGCDWVVLEVGLGGRYDSTNIIKNPLCTVITSISLDHCSVLGDSIDKIAYEKAGIIKKGVPVVVYDQEVNPELSLPVIKKEAEEKKAEFIKADFKEIKNVKYSLEGTVFDFEDFKEVKIKLLGKNQVRNAALALKVIETLKTVFSRTQNRQKDGLPESENIKTENIKSENTKNIKTKKVETESINISTEAIYEGMEKTKWGGRFEIINSEPLMIADGAHNPDGAKALADSIKLYLGDRPLVFVMGVFKDKDYRGILKSTANLSENIIAVTAEGKRALPKEELAKTAREFTKAGVYTADSVEEGIGLAKKLLRPGGAIVVFGSLSFLGSVYETEKGIGRSGLILRHSIFKENMDKIKEAEKDRIYCRHDLDHLLSVARIAMLNLENKAKKEMVYAAALLHDIGRADEYERGIPHDEAGESLAEKILRDCYFNENEIKEIKEAIECHRMEESESFLGNLIHEADHLSRNCFDCEAKKTCKWEEGRMNETIIW